MTFINTLKKRWPIVLLILGFIAILLIIVNHYSVRTYSPEEEYIEIPEPMTIYGIAVDSFDIEHYTITSGQNLSVILTKLGVPGNEMETLVQKAAAIFDLRKIIAGNSYITFSTAGEDPKLQYLVYEHNLTDYMVFGLKDSLYVEMGKKVIDIDTTSVTGTINSSLWNTLAKQGDDPFLAVEISEVFAWVIDFYAIQKGDSFNIIYERRSIDGEYVGHGRVLAAYFNHMSKDFYAFYFEQDSVGEYFDEQGQSVRREFLKAPLRFSRISSRFSNSRLHPILRIRRPHHGVDYAAPTGTPVQTIGNGTVIQANYSRGAGRIVKVRHNSVYTTVYMHLSKFGKGIKPGAHVTQGDVIGYVGSSGLSTGPHLDFRVYRNGSPMDPLKLESPPAEPVKEKYKAQYEEHMTQWKGMLEKAGKGGL